eukprot:scaffold416_cov329-Pavlova_lutheri.AAC.44
MGAWTGNSAIRGYPFARCEAWFPFAVWTGRRGITVDLVPSCVQGPAMHPTSGSKSAPSSRSHWPAGALAWTLH